MINIKIDIDCTTTLIYNYFMMLLPSPEMKRK